MLESVTQSSDLSTRLRELTTPVADLDEGLLVSATYDGEKRVAVLKVYDSKKGRVWLWEDNTGHRPYCYTKLSRAELDAKGVSIGRNGVVSVDEEQKLDLLTDSNIMVRRIVATDPLAIGGAPGSLREKFDCWEADIKYYENYAYDRGLKTGTYYKVVHGSLAPVE